MNEAEERGIDYTVEHVDADWLSEAIRDASWSQVTTSNDVEDVPRAILVFEDPTAVSGSYVELHPDGDGYAKVEASFALPHEQFDKWRFDMTRAECLMQNARKANNPDAMIEAYRDMCAIMSAATCRRHDESYEDARDKARELLWDMLRGEIP